jgi:hypothetical protein
LRCSCADAEKFLSYDCCEWHITEINSHNLIIGWNILDLIKKNTDAEQILPPKKGNGEEIH